MPRPNPQRRGFALFVKALWLATLVLSLSSCGNSVENEETAPELPDIEFQGNDLTHYNDEGKAVWTLHARSVQYFEERQQTQAQDVAVRFFDPDGAEVLSVQADALTFYHRTGDLEFSGNLQAHDPEGLRFSTDKAYWEEKARALRSDSPVHVEHADLTLTGQGFEYHPDEGILTIKSAQLKLMLKEPPP